MSFRLSRAWNIGLLTFGLLANLHLWQLTKFWDVALMSSAGIAYAIVLLLKEFDLIKPESKP